MLQHIDLLTDKVCSKPHTKCVWTYTRKHISTTTILHLPICSKWNMSGNNLTCDTCLFIEKLKPLFWNETMSNFVRKFSSHKSRKINFIPLFRHCTCLTAAHTQQRPAVLNWSQTTADIIWVLWFILMPYFIHTQLLLIPHTNML
jgi:hypothetical protein